LNLFRGGRCLKTDGCQHFPVSKFEKKIAGKQWFERTIERKRFVD